MIWSAEHRARVESFFHQETGSFTHLVHDGTIAAIIDPVLDYDAGAALTSTIAADAVLAFVQEHHLQVAWLLETHAHADHLSAAGYLHDALGAPVAIGRGIVDVQVCFKRLYGLDDDFVTDGSQFDRLFSDGDSFEVGSMPARAVATPGHTGDSITYLIGDAAFIGDTLFAPDTGTARCDFPGADAAELYRSICTILALPATTRLFLCHDYPSGGRAPIAQSSVGTQAATNVHIGKGTSESAFVSLRKTRDASLPVPRLILPSLQVNIRAGRLPSADANGIRYLRLPLDQIGTAR